jgi:hypothetical protein
LLLIVCFIVVVDNGCKEKLIGTDRKHTEAPQHRPQIRKMTQPHDETTSASAGTRYLQRAVGDHDVGAQPSVQPSVQLRHLPGTVPINLTQTWCSFFVLLLFEHNAGLVAK